MTFDPRQALVCARPLQSLAEGVLHPVITDHETDTQAHVFRLSGVNYVLFPGTASARDWFTDVRIAKWPWARGGWVHKGFRAALISVYAQIFHQLRIGEPIFVAGHSLGGALAQLCAHLLAGEGHSIHGVYTFGQPRVGNWTFARDYNAALHDFTYRIVNARDPVPAVPFVFGTYKHAGREIYLAADGRVRAEQPLWTSVLEAGATLKQMSQAGGARPQPSELISVSAHALSAYVKRLEELC